MQSADSVEVALALDGSKLEGRSIRVKRSLKKEKQKNKTNSQGNLRKPGRNAVQGSGGVAKPGQANFTPKPSNLSSFKGEMANPNKKRKKVLKKKIKTKKTHRVATKWRSTKDKLYFLDYEKNIFTKFIASHSKCNSLSKNNRKQRVLLQTFLKFGSDLFRKCLIVDCTSINCFRPIYAIMRVYSGYCVIRVHNSLSRSHLNCLNRLIPFSFSQIYVVLLLYLRCLSRLDKSSVFCFLSGMLFKREKKVTNKLLLFYIKALQIKSCLSVGVSHLFGRQFKLDINAFTHSEGPHP